MKKYLLDNKGKGIAAIVGLVAAGGLLYYFTRSPKQIPTPLPTVHNPILSKSQVSTTTTAPDQQPPTTTSDAETPQLLLVTLSHIRDTLRRTDNHLTPESLAEILRGKYTLAREPMNRAILKWRKMRRQTVADCEGYAKLVGEEIQEIQRIEDLELGKILAWFNIDMATWKDAQDLWYLTEDPEDGITELIRTQQQKQLLSLHNPTAPALSLQKILKALTYKRKLLQKIELKKFNIPSNWQQSQTYTVIQQYTDDLTYIKTGIQPEDLEYSIQHLSKKDKQRVIQEEEAIGDLMGELVQ